MSHIAIVTDSNSGITQEEGKALGIHVIPMPFFINERVYFEDIDLTRDKFYELLAQDVTVSTSQPSPGDILDLWEDLFRSYTEIVHIPMSSGLSASYETALGLAQEYEGKVQVVNNLRVSVTQQQAVMDAIALRDSGKSAQEIREILEKEAKESSIYLMVDTLKYLKKGGRITPAAALIGSALNLKPILQIQGDKLDAYKKVRGGKAAKKAIFQAIASDLQGRFAQYVEQGTLNLQIGYSSTREEAEQWAADLNEMFPKVEITRIDPLALSVACHTGPGVIGVALSHSLHN